jgi:hypothetical protein
LAFFFVFSGFHLMWPRWNFIFLIQSWNFVNNTMYRGAQNNFANLDFFSLKTHLNTGKNFLLKKFNPYYTLAKNSFITKHLIYMWTNITIKRKTTVNQRRFIQRSL